MSTLTREGIEETMARVNRLSRPFKPFAGMNVIEAPTRFVPKLKLSESAPVSNAFRLEFDAWLVQMFGMRDESVVPRDTAYVIFGDTVVMRPETVVRLRNFTA